MPGIVGLFTKMPREWAEPQLQKMAAAIRHESFYTNGSCIDESLGIYVSWVAHKNSCLICTKTIRGFRSG
jgi:asparagine synthase (glutamine-hydrolysing)